jgi:hypothetical protein
MEIILKNNKNMANIKTGVELIAVERERQIQVEGWTGSHDAEHDAGELAIAAACYATPEKIYVVRNFANAIHYVDPWPFEDRWDKRYEYGENKETGANYVPDPLTYTDEERIDLLVKAGALIAAEIDRLQGHGEIVNQ